MKDKFEIEIHTINVNNLSEVYSTRALLCSTVVISWHVACLQLSGI